MAIVQDTFTDTAATSITTHVGETGATWTKHTSYASSSMVVSDANRLRGGGNVSSGYYASGVPSTADYDVEADYKVFTTPAATQYGIAGRINTAANTMYYVRYRIDVTAWELAKLVNGTGTTLGTFTQTLTAGGGPTSNGLYHVKLELRGTTINVYIDGVLQITTTDSSISSVGRPGIRWVDAGGVGNAAGVHIDNFVASEPILVPANSVAPAVTGTPVVGQTLTTTDGTWSNVPTSFAYQWQNDSTGSYANIVGQTASTHVVAVGDVGFNVRCVVTATNAAGSASANSNAVAAFAEIIGTDVQWWTASASGLGGHPGVQLSSPTEVWDAVTHPEAQVGDVEYRLVFLKNTHAIRSASVPATWVATQTTSATTDIAIGLALESAGAEVAVTPDESTPPSGVTFTAPSSEGTGLSGATIPAGSWIGIWQRWTVVAGTSDLAADTCTMGWSATPA